MKENTKNQSEIRAGERVRFMKDGRVRYGRCFGPSAADGYLDVLPEDRKVKLPKDRSEVLCVNEKACTATSEAGWGDWRPW